MHRICLRKDTTISLAAHRSTNDLTLFTPTFPSRPVGEVRRLTVVSGRLTEKSGRLTEKSGRLTEEAGAGAEARTGQRCVPSRATAVTGWACRGIERGDLLSFGEAPSSIFLNDFRVGVRELKLIQLQRRGVLIKATVAAIHKRLDFPIISETEQLDNERVVHITRQVDNAHTLGGRV